MARQAEQPLPELKPVFQQDVMPSMATWRSGTIQAVTPGAFFFP
jgi:hypothetical protein